MTSRRVVVVGGGISGLAAAWAIQQGAPRVPASLDVLVLERDEEVGGKAHTVRRDGWLVEGGPAGYLSGRPAMERMVASIGMAEDVIRALRASARRYVFREGRMRRVIASPVGLVRSGLLTVTGAARLLGDLVVRRRPADAEDEESVWNFAARRLGAEVADRLVSPLCLGVYAGDARRLSLAAAFPRMAALEQEHGSLIRGMLAKRGRMSSGELTSFRHGMQSLPRALATRGGFTVRCGAHVRALSRTASGWSVMVDGDREPIPADAVVLAAEPWASAELLRALDPAAAAQLAAIPCPFVGIVALGYGPSALKRVPIGFGVLFSRGEDIRMLGNLWETQVYPGRGPEGHVLIRALFGGSVDQDASSFDADQLSALARAEIAQLYGISDAPVFEYVKRIPRAIPQYEIGHRERVVRVERALEALPGLAMTGSGLRGVAFADAASDGVQCGERVVQRLIAD